MVYDDKKKINSHELPHQLSWSCPVVPSKLSGLEGLTNPLVYEGELISKARSCLELVWFCSKVS